MKHRWIEAGKNVVIVALLLCSVVLTLYIISPGPLTELPGIRQLVQLFSPRSEAAQLQVRQSTVSEAVRPTALSVNTENGRTTWQYSFDASDSGYDSLGRWLGQALGTSGTTQALSDDEWIALLSCTGIYFRYPGSVPLDALADWLGADSYFSGIVAQAIVVAVRQDRVLLSWNDSAEYYSCTTQISAAALTQALQGYGGDGSLFAFEGSEAYPQLSFLAPDTLLNPSAPSLKNVSVQSSLSFENTAVTLGFNPYGESGYTAADGTKYFLDSGCRLQISGSHIRYTDTTGRFSAEHNTDTALTEAARALVEKLSAESLGCARLYLTDLVRENETVTLRFDYIINGVRVVLSDAAATVVFSGTLLTRLDLDLRTFTEGSDNLILFSALQAAALLSEETGLELRYVDTGDETLQCGWQAIER